MIKIIEGNKLITEAIDIETIGLRSHSYSIEPPTPRTNIVDVPGRNGALDMTDALGRITYQNRRVTFSGIFTGNAEAWHGKISELLNKYSGQTIKVVFGNDPRYFWSGRCTITHERIEENQYGVTFNLDAEPYKYPMQITDENWIWDPFDFENGVIRKYTNITVNGTKAVTIIGYQNEESPKFHVQLNQGQSSMRMVYDGDTYYLRNGLNSFPEISIKSEDIYTDLHVFTFTGYGKVTIDIKGGML